MLLASGFRTRPWRRAPLAVAVLLVAIAVVAPRPDVADAAAAGTLRLVSHIPASRTTSPNGSSYGAVSSADGGFVAFFSEATNLVAGQSDTNNAADVFLYEGATGSVTLVSHAAGSATTTANGHSPLLGVSISADGAFVAFSSTATNLVAGQSDTNSGEDVFLYDRATGSVTLVSHAAGSATTTGNGRNTDLSVSADGAHVAFESYATNLVLLDPCPPFCGVPPYEDDYNGAADVFLFERATGNVTLVSHTPARTTSTANNGSDLSSISANGAFVAFRSYATDLVTGQNDRNAAPDAFLFERATAAVALVSHVPGSATTTGNDWTLDGVQVSADGAFVAFGSTSTDLVAGQNDVTSTSDVFLFTRATETVTLVSHVPGSATTTPRGSSFYPSISADGRSVAFFSSATNLVAGQSDSNGEFDVFLFAAATGVMSLVSHTAASATTAANGRSDWPSVSADGSFVAFSSSATNLVAGQTDPNNASDVFFFEGGSATVTLVSHAPGSSTKTADRDSLGAVVSGDGGFVVFQSWASDLVGGHIDTNGVGDVFFFRRTPTTPPAADFDGDGGTDVGVFRPSSAVWFVRGVLTTAWGTSGDIPVPADVDGDERTDVAVFRPSSGLWFVRGGATVAWGTSGDIPVPGDYDGDGDADLAVFRPSTGVWLIGWVARGGEELRDPAIVPFGTAGDIPVPADYDGNGTIDIAVFRPSSGIWFVRGGPTVAWGTTGDIPVPGRYDTDTDTDIAVFRPSNGIWFVRGGSTTAWGTDGDVPVPGDYNRDGTGDVAVFRPSSGVWFVNNGTTTAWGTSGDVPLPLPDAVRRFFFTPL